MTVLKTSLRNFLAHKGRMALSAVAVLLSVAFVCGTLVFTDTMNTTFDKIFGITASDVSVSHEDTDDGEDTAQNGKPASLPASLVGQVAKVDGVASAEGAVSSANVTVVNSDNENMGSSTGAPTLAGNWTAVDERSMEITTGRAPRTAGEVMVDADTADKNGLKPGDELRTISVVGDHTARIVGIASWKVTNPGAAVVYFDTATAQRRLLGEEGRFTQVNVTAREGVTHEQLKERIAAALDGPYQVRTAEETAEANRSDLDEFMNVIKYAMLGFAGIAFLVGIFLIVNTFSMLVAQRTREIGLMRAIGSSRRQVNNSVLVEALLLGVVGSLLGVGAGVGIAVLLMKAMDALGMNLSTEDLTVKATTPLVGVLLGVVVTVLAAYLPARRAGKVSPMAALRDAGTPADAKAGRVRGVVGLVLTLAGAAALAVAANADEAADGSLMLGLGIVLTLIGFVAVGPLLAGGLVRVLGAAVLRVFGPVGRMAERNALRNPRRTGATGAALMIGLALVACLSVVGSSMVASATGELDKSVGADFIVQGTTQRIVPQAEKAMLETPGLAHVTSYREVDATLVSPDGGKDDGGVIAADPTYAEDLRRETVEGRFEDAFAQGKVGVGTQYAEKHGVHVGDTLTVAFAGGGTAKLEVAAVTDDDTAIDQGARYIGTETMRQYVPADLIPQNSVLFGKAEPGRQDAAYTALKKALADYPQYVVYDQTDYKQELRDQVGQLLNLVYGLLALAIVVAVLGVVNTLALSVVERTREIGLLRAIGLSRRQMRRMIRLESVVIALFGALLGLGLGMGWGTTAQRILALEGLDVLDIPWGTIAAVFIGSAFVGLIAALVPAFRAARMNVLNAIATD